MSHYDKLSKFETTANITNEDIKSISTITPKVSEYPFEYSQDMPNERNSYNTQQAHNHHQDVNFNNGTFDISQGNEVKSQEMVYVKPPLNPNAPVTTGHQHSTQFENTAQTISFRNRRRTKELIDQITGNELYDQDEKSMLIKIIQEKSQGGRMLIDSSD